MARDRDSLLGQIERDLLDESKPIAAALRKCVILGGHAGSAKLREWAARELHGYRDHLDDLPDCRKIPAPLQIDGISGNRMIRGEPVGSMDLPEFARDVISDEMQLTQGIGQIEAWISQAEPDNGFVRLGVPGGADLARLWTHELGNPYRSVSRVYWSVSAATLRGVIDAVRTALAELLGELRAGTPAGQDVPTAEVAGRALEVVLHGNRHRVTINQAAAAEGGSATNRVRLGRDRARLLDGIAEDRRCNCRYRDRGGRHRHSAGTAPALLTKQR
jgi:hypothetical protein